MAPRNGDSSGELKASVATAVATGDLRFSLTAVRDRLALLLDETEGAAAAAIAKQLTATVAALESLTPVEESKLDELRQRRSARGAKSSERAGAGGSSGRVGGGRAR